MYELLDQTTELKQLYFLKDFCGLPSALAFSLFGREGVCLSLVSGWVKMC